MSSTADNLVSVLRAHAERHPENVACGFLVDGESELRRWTYGELDLESRRAASLIQDRLAPGARAVLVYEPGLDFVAAFFGCLYAGVVAVPVVPPIPSRPEDGIRQLARVVRDSGAEVVLTSELAQQLAVMLPSFEASLGGLPVMATNVAGMGDPAAWRDPGVRGSSLALLQYTSGSVTDPKGVILRHQNLVANQAAIAWSLQVPDDAVMASWLPMYHDMGLIGTLINPLYRGAATYLMSPHHFLQRPLRWLLAVTRFHAYISGAPDFAYELCAKRVSEEDRALLDLSSWRIAFNGSEPVRAHTVHAFQAAFSSCGFAPECLVGCYGLAEASLIVSGAWASDEKAVHVDRDSLEQGEVTIVDPSDAGAVELVSVGHTDPNHSVKVVDPHLQRPTPQGRIGEIWFRGPSVADGYWNRHLETDTAFVADAGGDERYLRTGDLGFVMNGQLFVTGRIKDVLVVHGRNLYPPDIDDAAQRSDPRFRRGSGVAFAVDVDGSEAVGLVQETPATEPEDLAELARFARVGVFETLQISLAAVYLVSPRSIRKTSSGKLMRGASRRALLAGKLNVLYELNDLTARVGTAASTV